MDRKEYVHKRKGRYMAQTLEHFEEHIEPHLPPEMAAVVADHKGLVRARMNALAVDACDVMTMTGEAQNGLALEIRDELSTSR